MEKCCATEDNIVSMEMKGDNQIEESEATYKKLEFSHFLQRSAVICLIVSAIVALITAIYNLTSIYGDN